jgi:hypothetical protein
MNEPVELGMVLEKYGELLRHLDRYAEAAEVQARVKAIHDKLATERSAEPKDAKR